MTWIADTYAAATVLLGAAKDEDLDDELLDLDDRAPYCPACGDAATCIECTGVAA
jgi:hypothetical protein